MRAAWRIGSVLLAVACAATLVASVAAQARRSSASVLSEHEIEALDSMSAQSQAELLIERSINHFRGANEQIAARVDRWRGRIELNARLNNLFVTAINSDDLVVRTAALEVDLAARNLEKNRATVDRLEPDARSGAQGPRANALWDLGLLGNRGIEPQRVAEILLSSIHDENVNVRYWAVEGLAYLGTDETIAPLLDIFHDDPSPTIRERAACSLAQSGMLSDKQRHTAVPRLLDYAEDYSLDAQTRSWVFQALRDITGQSLPHEPTAWRRWYLAAGSK
jgi:HEAT repeat protein